MKLLQLEEGRFSLPFLIYFTYSLAKRLWLCRLDGAAFWIADMVSYVVIPVVLIFAFRLPLRASELRDPPARQLSRSWGPVLFNGFLVACGVRIVFVVGALLLSKAGVHDDLILPPTIAYADKVPKSAPWFYMGIIYLALSAALVEEYFYRYLLRAAWRQHSKSAVAFVLVSATTFALVHWGNGARNVITAFFAGLLLATVYVRVGDLRVPITGHALDWLRRLLP
jgi:membrane protease YdiL (CAAX protease family)